MSEHKEDREHKELSKILVHCQSLRELIKDPAKDTKTIVQTCLHHWKTILDLMKQGCMSPDDSTLVYDAGEDTIAFMTPFMETLPGPIKEIFDLLAKITTVLNSM